MKATLSLARTTALFFAGLASAGAHAATTTTVTDLPMDRGTIRISHTRPDAPLANVIVLTGGNGILGLQADGTGNTVNYEVNTPGRNRQRFVDLGYSVVLVDAPSDMLESGMSFDFRASTVHLSELREVLRHVRQRDDIPTWIVGFSAGAISAANMGLNLSADPPFGLVLLSPNTVDAGSLLGMNLEAMQRPTMVVSHQLDPCPVTPPANALAVLNRLTATPARRHVEFTGGSGDTRPVVCDSTGHHGLGGQDAEFVAVVADWMTSYAVLVQAPNFQGLWWKSPAGSESGWGVNLTHQGDILFGTWFTYDSDGSGMWLVMSNGARIAANSYSGALYRTTGPAFSSIPFNPAQVGVTQVGSATFTFGDSSNGTFTYTVNGVTQSKQIARQIYQDPVPACIANGSHRTSPNYQALWWGSPPGSESGWGVNLTHQGDILFATWFTYASDGRAMWLVMSNGAKTGPGTYAGALFRTTGPAFSANPWNGSNVAVTQVGTATLRFADANNGTFSYTVDGVSQSKPITRQVYSIPETICR